MTYVVDASLVLVLLANRQSDELLRKRLAESRTLHAPHLIDAEITSGVFSWAASWPRSEPARCSRTITHCGSFDIQ